MCSKSHIYYSHVFSRTLTWILVLTTALITTVGAVMFLIMEYSHPGTVSTTVDRGAQFVICRG